MADRPEDDLPFYDVMATVVQHRVYRVQGNGVEDARAFFENEWGNLDFDVTDELVPLVHDIVEVER